MSRAKRWVFTLNNPTDEEQHSIATHGTEIDDVNSAFTYLIVGREVGDSGTPHLQGFFILRSQTRLPQCKAIEGFERAHLEVSRGTPDQAAEYCRKDGDFDEYGTLPQSQQGKRGEFEAFRDWLKEQDTRPTHKLVGELFPSLLGRYPGAVDNFIELYGPKPSLVDGPLRPWQHRLDSRINRMPDDRRIIFVVDEEGKTGKSWLTRYWFSTRDDFQRLSIGKRDDLAYCLDVTKKVFAFDIPRGSMEFLQYSILEQLKDQMVFSPKYKSTAKIFPEPVHVIVFCNEEPDRTKMTPDRYKIMNLRTV